MAETTEDTVVETPLQGLLKRRKELHESVVPLIEARRQVRTAFDARKADEDESKRPTAEERASYISEEETFNEQVAEKLSEIKDLDVRIEQEQAAERSLEIAQNASRTESITITHQPLTYREDNQRVHSYFLDLAAKDVPEVRSRASGRIDGFQERLDAHAKEMAEEMPRRFAEAERRAQTETDRAEIEFRKRINHRGSFEESPFSRNAQLESRAPTRIVGQGGYAIPPLWLIDDYIGYLRPGRVAAGLARNLPLPPGTDSINVPRLSTPTLTAVQTADAAPVASRDIQDTFQQANVKTVAGQEDVPIQLVEQSPGQILDRVIMTDLIADYNQKVDLQVILGNGTGAPLSGGQVVGLYPSTNWGANVVTWTNGTPYPVEFFQVLGAMASKTAYSRFNLQDFNFLMHPRRWFWGATGVDSSTAGSGRFVANATDFPAFNVAALENNPAPYEGLAGRTPFGPSVYIDANIPITDNGSGSLTGSNDVVIAAIWDDIWLFEGDLRTRVLSEVLSGTLELRFQVWGYLALLARYGVSTTIAQGSAFAQPYTQTGSSTGVAY